MVAAPAALRDNRPMKKLIPLLLILAGCNTTVSKEEMEGVDYGAKPTHWQEDIRSYLSLRLNNPKQAVVEFPGGEPKKLYQRGTPVRDKQWGWGVCVWIKDKDKDGKDDYFPMTFIFRGEKMEFINGGPDDANVIGARYSRDQCDRLGTPFIPL